MNEYFEIGRITNTHGLKGELKVQNFARSKDIFENLKTILVDTKKELKEYEIIGVRYQNDIVLLRLNGIDDIEVAEELKGYYIKIPREFVVKDDDEYFIADILGCKVYEGELIGTIEDIYPITGTEHDVYSIKRVDGSILVIPATSSIIKNIDVKNKRIDVEIPVDLKDEDEN